MRCRGRWYVNSLTDDVDPTFRNALLKVVSVNQLNAVRVTRILTRVVSTFREHLLSGFSWNVVAAVAMQGSVLVSSIIVARLLGLVSFGSYSLLVSTVMTVAAVAQGGSGLAATKLVGEFLAFGPERVGRLLKAFHILAFATGAIAAVLILVLAEVLALDLFARPELLHSLQLVALATFFLVFSSHQIGALQGFGAFREMSRAGVLAGLCHVAFTSLGAYFGEVTGALLGFVAASAFRAVLFGYALRSVRRAHGVRERVDVAYDDFRPVWRFAVPAGLAGIVTMPCLWLVTVLVSRLPEGLALVAMLSVAHQLRLAVLQLPSLLNSVSFSVLSRLKGQNEAGGFRNIFWLNFGINAVFATLAVAVLVGLSDLLLALFGREFGDGRWLLVILLLSVIPESIAMSFYQLIQSAGRMWQSLFFIAIPRDVGYLAAAAMLVPQYGVVAAAAAYLGAQVLGLACTAVAAYRSSRSVFQ